MKTNFRLTVSYDGTRYLGWAKQPGKPMTIQGKLESVLTQMAGDPVEVIGAGRTDAGVHAEEMTANFHLDTENLPEESLILLKPYMQEGMTEAIGRYMNHYLPEDICIREIRIASDRFHSRYNAVGKTYRYTCYVGKQKPMFDRKYVYVTEGRPDVEKMREAAERLLGIHDFAAFAHNPRMKKSTVREVDRIEIRPEGDYLIFTYHGSGFLQYMVRILTGTLLEVGFGQRSPESMTELLESKDRTQAGFTAPAKGLCMVRADY